MLCRNEITVATRLLMRLFNKKKKKRVGTQYIDRGWSVSHIYKRGLLLLSSDIDVGRENKTKCIFFPALKHADKITSCTQLRIIKRNAPVYLFRFLQNIFNSLIFHFKT